MTGRLVAGRDEFRQTGPGLTDVKCEARDSLRPRGAREGRVDKYKVPHVRLAHDPSVLGKGTEPSPAHAVGPDPPMTIQGSQPCRIS